MSSPGKKPIQGKSHIRRTSNIYFKLQKLYHRLNQPITGTRFHFDLRTIIHKTKCLTHSHQHKNVKKKKIEKKEEK